MKPSDPDAPVGPFANEVLDTVIHLALKRDEAERSYHASRVRVHSFMVAAGLILGLSGLYHEGYIGDRPLLGKKPNPVSLPIALGAALAIGAAAQMATDRYNKGRGKLSPGDDAQDWDEELYEITDKAAAFEEPQFKYAETPDRVRQKQQRRVLELV